MLALLTLRWGLLAAPRCCAQVLDGLAGVALKVGTAPLQRLEDLLAFMPQEIGGKVLSTRQRMWLQLLGTAMLQDVGEAVAGSNEAADAPVSEQGPGCRCRRQCLRMPA